MVRTQIQLTEDQSKAVKALAKQQNISMAELIRQALDFYLHKCGLSDPEVQRKRAIQAVGQFRSNATDLSTNHDLYLVEAYGE